MSIRPADRQQPPAPVTQSTRTSGPAAPEAQTQASSFANRSAQQPVALQSSGNQAVASRGVDFKAPQGAGPVELSSAEGKKAIQDAVSVIASQQGIAAGNVGQDLSAFSVEKDDLGITHVRLDRTHNGVPVLGDQMIVHIRPDGSTHVTGEFLQIPDGVGTSKGNCDEQKALDLALGQFEGPADADPSVRKVIVANPDGTFSEAFQVEVSNFTTFDGNAAPMRMNYLVDVGSGAISESWNQMGGLDEHQIDRLQTVGGNKAAAAGDTIETRKTAEPGLAIEDNSVVTSELEVPEDLTLETLSVDLNIPHTWKGDLKVTLVSPSGKEVVIHDRKGGSQDNIEGNFDLTEAFAGENSKGTWTLKVEDKAKRDTGTLQSWSLNLKGKDNTPPPPVTGDDTTKYSGTVDIGATQNEAGGFDLKDGNRGQGVITRDAKNASSGSAATVMTDDNNIWGEESDGPNQQAGVDAQYGAQMTYDMYKNILGRDSIDGKGEALVSNVHIRKNYVNAFWDGKTMNYGDGDNKTASVLTTLDIAGHEITHGLTQRTAGLIYRNESGGLNEAMSDIMGTGVEWYASQQNPTVKFDWAVGEDCWTPNNGDPTDALRYMDDPTKDKYSVDHYSNYPKQTEVHGSSGIANNAFYLLAEGGTNRTSQVTVEGGVGVEDALKIYGRALIHYMTPNTTFSQGRDACIAAATDLFGADSVQVQKVKESWSAVGVETKAA